MDPQQQQQQQYLVDFGQRVDLTASIRQILINYPEGTSILKELVQNADDAKATTVRFVLDHNHYATGSLLSPQLGQFQGPALLAFNDGVFAEKDFESISRIGDSKKREQAGKTGRFGVGFNAVYHLTDLPGFVSGQHMVMFDPHCKYLPNISAANPGKKVNYVEHDIRGELADQVAPFQLFGCDTRQDFQGTLFRFPLRTQEQADASTISKQVYAPASILALFEDLKLEASLVLLFLKSVCSIEVMELRPGQAQPQLLFSCSVVNRTQEVLQQRAMFTTAVSAPLDQQVSGAYQLELELKDTTSARQQVFLISQRRGPPQLLAMAQDLSKQFQVPLIAWGAVAADITPGSQQSGDSADNQVAPGRAFCFLPLPALTSLPVHINGFFELSSNRRDVWHGGDMAGTGRLRAQWNDALLQLVVAPAYLDLLAAAAQMLGPGLQFNRLWPSCEAPEPWQGVVRQLYGHLPGKQLLWTAANGGQWLTVQQCMFADAACLQQDAAHVLDDSTGCHDNQQQGINPAAQSAAFSDVSTAGLGGASFGPLGTALITLGLPLAELPGSVLAMMMKLLPELPQQCTPSAARRAVKANAGRVAQLDRQQQLVPLLAYCLRDLELSSGPTGSWLQQLLGLKLLPVADGSTLTAFEASVAPSGPHQLVFVVTDALEQSLVQSQRGLLLEHELLGPELTAQLSLLASFDSCNLKHLSLQHLVSTFLPCILPAAWLGKAVVDWAAPEGTSQAPVTWEWLQSLWQWLAAHRQSLQPLSTSAWPLLPVVGSKLVPLRPLDRSPVVLPGADAWPTGLAEVLGKLGVHVLDTASFELPLEALRGQCVHSAGGTGVAAAICAALGLHPPQQDPQQQQQQQQQDAVAHLSAAERGVLRSFLLQPTWFAGAAAAAAPVAQLQRLVRQLPLFALANSSQQKHQALSAAESAGGEPAASDGPVFVNLEGTCCLTPPGIHWSALSSSYVLAANDQEAAVMVRHLGVQAPTAAQVYRREVLPRLSSLPQMVRDPAMLLMLRHLSDLQQQDRSFTQLLSGTAFLPSGNGELHVPSDLYDPRIPELVALLDPEACFPAPAFCGDVSDAMQDGEQQQQRDGGSSNSSFSSLVVLQQLGLRCTAQLDTLVLAARFVQKVAADGDEDMAVARGKALLAFLNTESERMVGQHTAITSAAAAAVAAATGHRRSSSTGSSAGDSDGGTPRSGAGRSSRPNRPGQGLFKAMQRGLIGLGSKLQGFDQQQAGGDGMGAAGQQQQQQLRQSDGPTAAQIIQKQWLQLSQLCWCPVLTVPPDAALPWRDTNSTSSSSGPTQAANSKPQRLAAPCAVRPHQDIWLVSAVKAVVDGECQSQVALAGLGWTVPLTGAELGSQLAALGSKHRQVPDAHLAQQLARIVPQLYMALDNLPATELSAAAAVLEGQPSVWVGNGFVDASRVAFKGGMDLSPHLYVLPLELTPFQEVLAALGAQEAFSAAQYTTVLQDLANEAAGKPLQPKQLAQALGVAQALADVLGASGGGATAGKQAVHKAEAASAGGSKAADVVLVPDDSGVMRPAADLAFDDAPWLDGASPAAVGADGDLRLVHPRIAAPVAEALGVASRRRLLLAASADCLALGLAGAGGAVEAFGQSEALTTRLRHIIQDYPEGPGVLLELVQNADDAGATKAAFLLDMRSHGTSSLLGPGMAAWQGPAVLAYNNTVFSPGDFSAIASIGQDGKMSQPAAIGRFGLGFNAVYHLTDLPSFVSGQHLVLFDPHARFLPGASAAQPGLRVNLQRGRLLQQFPDAFAPYKHFGCTMEGSFPGTLFRFPLRSNSTAASSNIKAQPTSTEQALELLQSLTEVLPQALLFLKALQEIEVYAVGDSGAAAQAPQAAGAGPEAAAAEAPRLLFRATLKPLDGKESLQRRITHFVSSGGGGSGAQQLDAFFRRLESVKEDDLPCSMGKVQLSLSVAGNVGGKAAQVQDVTAASTNADTGVTEVVREDWLVCNQLGGGEARAMALQAWKKEKVKMVPWVGVATHLATHVSVPGYSSGGRSLSCRSSTGGRAFCFLPLPADTSLPVHINGYFELSSNRRDVWHGDDMAGAGQRRARWNEALLGSAIAPAYAALIQEASRLLGPCSDFWRLLPLGKGSVPEPWLRVAAALYARLAGRPVLYSPVDGGKWLAPQQVLLPDAACLIDSSSSSSSSHSQGGSVEDGGVGDHTEQLRLGYVPPPLQASLLAALLVQCGVPLVMGLSAEQQRCMLQWSANVGQITPAAARKLLRPRAAVVAETLSRHLRQQQECGSTSQPAAADVLQYCLSDVAAASVNRDSSSSSGSTAPGQVVNVRQQQASGQQPASQPGGTAQLRQALQQLSGLKLLPLADGQLQAIQAAPEHGPLQDSGSRRSEQSMDAAVYVAASQQEQQLLGQLKHLLLHEGVGSSLRQQLQSIAAAGVSNIHALTARQLDSHVLGLLLPPEWHSSSGHVEVSWHPPPGSEAVSGPADGEHGAATALQRQQQQPSQEFIQLCWQWLADRSDAADVLHWPLLPVTGGKLRLLQQPAQVLRAGDWTEQLMSALTKLGCCLLDTRILPSPSKALAAFVQEPTAAGLLDALAAAQAISAAGQAQLLAARNGRGGPVSTQARWHQLLQQLTGAERHHLRTYLLQAKWFASSSSSSNTSNAGFSEQQLQALRSLPVFEVHAPLGYEEDDSTAQHLHRQQQQQQDEGLLALVRAGISAGAAGAGTYRALTLQGSQQLLLPPVGINNGRVLGSQFLKCESDAEEAMLTKHLGVRRLSMQEFVMLHLAKAPQQLEPRALISTVASILCRLRDLSSSEPDLALSIKVLPLIPTRASLGSSSSTSSSGSQPADTRQRQQQPVLAAPCDLFDPRNKVLVELLGDNHFPAAPFDGSVDSRSAAGGITGLMVQPEMEASMLLQGLTLCGLRKQLDLEVLVVAAQDIAQQPPGDPAAQARAQLLLHHLDQWAQQHTQPNPCEAEQWRRLQTLPWCPVLATPPEQGLPWPHAAPPLPPPPAEQQAELSSLGPDEAGGTGQLHPEEQQQPQQQRVWRAAPKMVAPAEMAWLVSGPLRLLAAPSPSQQLRERLGWSHQQVLRPFTASVQLAQLGDLYPAGTVADPQQQARLAAAAGLLYDSLAPYVEDEDQLQLLKTNLLGAPCLWVGTGFAFPAVTALQTPESSASKPGAGGSSSSSMTSGAAAEFASLLQQQQLLYLVPPQLLQQHPGALSTLQALHVPPHWDFAAYAIALAVLAERSAGRSLTEQELELALLLADTAAAAQVGTSSMRQLQQDHVAVAANVLKVAAAGPGGVVATGGPDLLVLPDADGVMAGPSELYFNDAAWLGAEGLRLAHASLRQDTAEALGVRSMRWQHQTNESLTKAISCPTVDTAASAAAAVIGSCQPPESSAAHTSIGATPATAAHAADAGSLLEAHPSAEGPALLALLALLKWADSLCGADAAAVAASGGHSRRSSSGSGWDSASSSDGYHGRIAPALSFNVVLDERQHGTQSLLHSGLSRLQGPALCVAIKGISSLSADKLGQLLQWGAPVARTSSSAGPSASASAAGPAAIQQGLSSAWAVTDVLQAMSGDTTCYWDPSGQALAQTVKEMRQQAPRGRSVNHTQPELAQRFEHQWQVWDACRAGAAAAAVAGKQQQSGSRSGSEAGSVPDALYLRLPLRLQDQKLQGSAIAAAAGARLGVASHAVGLSLEDVRRQVAAFGPAAARSLLFLGHLQSVSVSTWPASAPTAVRVWEASLTAPQTGTQQLRVGMVPKLLQAKYREKGALGPGALLARIASGARGGMASGGKLSHRECWSMLLHTQHHPQPLQQLRDGQQQQQQAARPQAQSIAQDAQQQEPGHDSDDGVAEEEEGTPLLTAEHTSQQPPQPQQQQHDVAEVCRSSCEWLISVAGDLIPPSDSPSGNNAPAASMAAAAATPTLSLAAVAVCTAQEVTGAASLVGGHSHAARSRGIVPVSGAFSGVALPSGSGGIFGQQQFLVNIQGAGAAAAFSPPVHQRRQLAAAAAGPEAAAAATAAGVPDALLDAALRLAMSELVSAWREVLVNLRGLRQQLYCLMPDLVGALQAGNGPAAYAFKQMYQDAAGMPIWQLHSGACVHLQEGAFLPPRRPPAVTAGTSASGAAASAVISSSAQPSGPQTGLGEEAREFIMQQLPLFQVPWVLVEQLEAANISGLRIISPSVLRPLLRAQQPKGPNEAHPFITLTATQALQLLEYCCSDLGVHDDRRVNPRTDSTSASSREAAAAGSVADASAAPPAARAAAAAAAAGGGGAPTGVAAQVAAVEASLPENVPQGAASAVADVFGPAGLAALGGLANQMQQRLFTGVDEVMNLVMDAMGPMQPDQQEQQQQLQRPDHHAAAAAAAAGGGGASHVAAATAGQPSPSAAAAAGDGRRTAEAAHVHSPVNLNKVPYLKGLPIPTAAGTIAMLGVAQLYVFPPQCSPAPTTLMPAHLLRQFVLPECISALAWLLKYPEIRQQLRLSYYGLDQIATHLREALGPTWTFVNGSSSDASSMAQQQQRGAAPACMPGTPGFPAVVAWEDGAAGGPYLGWLTQLWQVILHTVAATPEWEQSLAAAATSASTGSSSSSTAAVGGTAAAGVAEGIRNAAQRARGFAEAFAGDLAQALNVPPPAGSSAAAAGQSSSGLMHHMPRAAATSAAAATAAAAAARGAETERLWRPLLDWPLLPLADGRLLKLRYRELALAVLPEYQDMRSRAAAAADAGDAEAISLHEPWDWLLPALCAAGQPLLDPRFNFLISAAAGTAAPASASASTAAAAVVPPLPVHLLLGDQPLLGRPPFLGPLVRKLAATQQVLGGFDWDCSHSRTVQQLSTGLTAAVEPWDESRWTRLFTLLADHPPRDLLPDGIQFLRDLPMYRLVQQPQPQQQTQAQAQLQQLQQWQGMAAEPQLTAGGADSAAAAQASGVQLVALGSSTNWVLAPTSVLQACAGLRALPSLPSFSTDHVLEHRPGWGELYDIVGLEPASLAQLLQVLLLPYLVDLTAADRLAALEFIRAHWTQSRQYSGPLSTVASFTAALRDLAFVPAAGPATLLEQRRSSSSQGIIEQEEHHLHLQQQVTHLYRPAQLFDPSVPLFAAVMTTMAGAHTSIAAAGTPVLFPADPYNRDEWLRLLRDLGLQHKVTKETFMQLAQQVAREASALATQPAAAGSSSRTPGLTAAAAAGAALTAGGGSYVDVTGADRDQVDKVEAAADALLAHLRSHWTGLGQDRDFWQALARVEVWPATLGVGGGRLARKVFASAAGVAQHKDWPLVWSAQPTLAPQRVPVQTLRQQLGMRSPPPLSVVLQHLQTVGQDGGEDMLAAWPDDVETFTNVTLQVLQHLDKEGISPQQAMQLAGAAFIPVAHASRLVAPQQLFLKLGGAALAPFAWEVPGQFVGHAVLLKQLGVKDEPRAEDLVNALWRFAGQLSGRRMNPNELAACMRLLSYLCSRAVSSADASFLASARRRDRLLVPTAGALLLPASRVVHMSSSGGSTAAARLLGRTDPQHLVLAHPQLPEHVCRWLGVSALSECLVEELDPATSDLTALDVIGTVRLTHIRALLSSPAFASAAFSIAAAHATAVPALRQLDLGSVTRLCAAASQGGRLRFVQKLATKVVLCSSKEDVTKRSAAREVYEFYEQGADSAAVGTMYVAVPPQGLPLSALLAQVLSRALGCPFTLPLHPLLEVPDATQLAQLQPVLHAGGYDSELEGALAAGHVGAPLQPGDKALLKLRPLRHYEAGELVAVKRRLATPAGQEAAAAAEARAARASKAAAATAEEGGGGGGMVLCYGRVAMDAAPQPGQAAYRLSVEVAPGVYESLLSTQVFCFQSGAQHTQPAADAAPAAAAEAAGAGSTPGAAGGSRPTADTAADNRAAAPAQQASELASAVADMLSAAGMPLDLDKQQLLQTALAANSQLQQASAAVAELHQEATRKENELEALRSSWQCRVCFSRDVEQAFVACGHMFCGDCMPSLQRCPVCRKPSTKIKLYR